MAAKVVYNGGVSYTIGGKKWMRGKPEVITNESKIARFRLLPGFTVSEVKAPAVSKKKASRSDDEDTGTTPKPVKKKKAAKKKKTG